MVLFYRNVFIFVLILNHYNYLARHYHWHGFLTRLLHRVLSLHLHVKLHIFEMSHSCQTWSRLAKHRNFRSLSHFFIDHKDFFLHIFRKEEDAVKVTDSIRDNYPDTPRYHLKSLASVEPRPVWVNAAGDGVPVTVDTHERWAYPKTFGRSAILYWCVCLIIRHQNNMTYCSKPKYCSAF